MALDGEHPSIHNGGFDIFPSLSQAARFVFRPVVIEAPGILVPLATRSERDRRRLPARMTLMAQLLKKAELAEFKALLDNIQARLRGDVQQLTTEALGTDREDGGTESKSPTHMAELGSETFEQDFALSLVVNQQETLAEIKVALEKIKDGTYGLCELCLKEGKTAAHSLIKKERLKAIPYARNCVECERKRSTR